MPGAPDAARLIRLLGNDTNRDLLGALQEGPSYPRALAKRVGRTEGRVQKHLHDLADVGLVEGEWNHHGKTVKEYRLRVHDIHLHLEPGGGAARNGGALWSATFHPPDVAQPARDGPPLPR